jgi:hypothetical protein
MMPIQNHRWPPEPAGQLEWLMLTTLDENIAGSYLIPKVKSAGKPSRETQPGVKMNNLRNHIAR